MRQIVLSDTGPRCVSRRRWISDNAVIFVLCGLFTIVGVLLTQNELYFDQMYYESSADGLFGKDNISLLSNCTNFLMEGIIYLLSLSGIRLYWYNLILIFINLVSSILVCKAITVAARGRCKFPLCLIFLVVITTRVFFFLQFTVIATYAISAGCLWIFYSIELQKPKSYYIFGILWTILGATIRIDCVAFPLGFMGIVWIFKNVKITCHNRRNSQNLSSKMFLRYFVPFAMALFLIAGIEIFQQVLMEHVNPGYKVWNDHRFHVAEYELPDYDEFAQQYQDLGLSRNDYIILQSWNSFDPEFFSDEMYEKLFAFQSEFVQKTEMVSNPVTFLIDVFRRMTGSPILGVGILITICAFACGNMWIGMCCLALMFGAGGLHAYFTYAGRLIDRTEYSIWIAMLIAMVSAFVVLGPMKNAGNMDVGKTRIKGAVIGVLFAITIFAVPTQIETSRWVSNIGMSIAQIYKARLSDPFTYGRYLYQKIFRGDSITYTTYDEAGYDYFIQNKDILFYMTFTSDWKQTYPVLGRDILRTAPISGGENILTGSYTSRLQPMKRTLKEWNITNPIKSMVTENMRVVFKDVDLHDRSYEINTYLKEHYYENVNFSIEEVINRTVIGRYMLNFDLGTAITGYGNVHAVYHENSPYAGMSQITLYDISVDGYFAPRDDAYIEIHTDDGRSYTCVTMDNGNGQLSALFYDDIIRDIDSCSVDFIYSHGDQLYTVNVDI